MAGEWEDAPSSGWEDAPAPKAPAAPKPYSQMEELGEFAKGAGLPIAGAMQSIPYEPVQKAATRYVQEVEKQPEYVRPGAFVGPRTMGKGMSEAVLGAIPVGKGFEVTSKLPAVAKGLSRILGGGAIGGLTGSVMETAPTVEEIGPRKAEAAKSGAIAGATITAGLSGLGALSKGAYDLVMKAKGKQLQEGLNSLKGMVGKEVDEARNFLQQKAAEVERQATSEVATAKDITEARYATRDKLTKDLDVAKKDVESSVSGLSKTAESDENLGKFIQTEGKKNIKSIRGATEKEAIQELKDPAFEQARQRAMAGDTLNTNPNSAPILNSAIADLRQQIADVPVGFRANLEKDLKNLIGGENGQLTLQQAEFLRRWAKDPILRKDSGFGALDATRMARLGDKIEQAMTAYEPRVGQYINRYKTGKETERMALGRKKGEGPIEEAVKSEEETIFASKPQQVASIYLDGTRESANKLIRLVGGKSPELVNRVRANFRGKIDGMNAEQTANFIAKNDGTLQAFPEIRDSLNKVLQARQTEERLSSMLGKSKGRLEKALGAEVTTAENLASQVAKGEKSMAPYRQFMEKFDGAKGDEIFKESTKIVDKLRSDGLIDAPKYQQMLSEIRDIEQKYGSTEAAKGRIKTVLYVGLVGFGGYKVYRGAKDVLGLGGQ